MFSSPRNVLQSLMIKLCLIQQILFLIVYHLFNSKTRIFLRLYAPFYNKAHGYDDISIGLLKICDSSVVKPLLIIFKIVYKLGLFLATGKSQMLYLSIKMVTSNFCKIITQFRCCQYVVKFLKELFSTQCLNFLNKIVFSVHNNLDFVHVKVSYYPLFMTSMLVLINVLPLK